METAPKDRDILAYNPLVGVYHTRHKLMPPDDASAWPCYFWGTESGRWYPEPTHWMEKPEPPAA